MLSFVVEDDAVDETRVTFELLEQLRATNSELYSLRTTQTNSELYERTDLAVRLATVDRPQSHDAVVPRSPDDLGDSRVETRRVDEVWVRQGLGRLAAAFARVPHSARL